ncbi:MAG TPA: hypothetical protein VJP85_05620 [Candidatus Baltobacteraceae bacterium]|nr:hypothetical protein [Candidatus Baltobacteraceae bacterium]
MIKIVFAAASLLSVLITGADRCAPGSSAKPGIVCVVGALKKGGDIRNVYASDGAQLIVEQTDAACIRDTHAK